MKILQFTHTYGEKNGIACHVQCLVASMPQGTECIVVAGSGKGLPLFSSLRIPTIEIIRALRADFDVVHIHGYGNFFSLFGALVAMAKRKPLVWTIHGYPQIRGARRLLYYVYRHLLAPFIFLKAGAIISVSNETVPLLRKETRKEIIIVRNGVDLSLFTPQGDYRKAKLACFVGRLDPDKGAERMLECRTLPLYFIGPDEDGTREKIECAAKTAGASASFAEADYASMPQEYAKCRYVVLPSKYEGFPLTLLESIACGRPFVATDVGEIGRTLGELFDEPEKYLVRGSVGETIACLEKQDLTAELASARKRLERYSWKCVAEKVGAIYRKLC